MSCTTERFAVVSLFLALVAVSVFAQDTTRASISPLSNVVRCPNLSANPTPQELADVFRAAGGDYTSDEAVNVVAQKGDTVLDALSELLSNDTNPGTKQHASPERDDSLVFAPYKMLAIQTLEAIGTPKAIGVLVRVIDSRANAEMRGYALDVLANKHYERAQKEKEGPDKEIIRGLFLAADDQTHIGFLQKSIGQIAHEGMKNWLGQDFDDKHADQAGTTRKESHKHWWQQNGTKLQWNADSGHFEVRK